MTLRWHTRRQRGTTLLFAALMILVVGLLTATVFDVASSSSKLASSRLKRGRLRGYAENGVANAYYQVWNVYLASKANHQAGNYADYSAWLTNAGIAAGGSNVIVLNEATADRTNVQASITRRDVAGSSAVYLTVVATAKALDGEMLTIQSVFMIGGKPYQGFGYGLLTRNVDCMMCHIKVNNVDMVNNTSAANYGTFANAKVGITDQAVFRSDVTATLGGALITRGPVMDESGNALSTLPKGITSLAISSATGDISQSANGSTTTVGTLTAANGTPPPANAYLYENYPTDPSQETDGQLPTDFPSPFNGMDYATWAQSSANGNLSGGVIYQQTGTYSGASLPTSGNTPAINGFTTDTNATFLVGTQANPIVINGTVGLSGDVVISGYVKGSGEIAAQGNLYVMGDLQYSDGTNAQGQRTYGTAQDGTTNAVALTAGGNVMVGNYIETGNGAVMGPKDGTLLNNEIGTFNRNQWQKTQKSLPNSSGTMVPNATYDPSFVPRYYTFNEGDPVYVEAPVPGQSTLTTKDIYWDAANSTWQGGTGKPHDLSQDNKVTPNTGDNLLALNPSWISNSNLNTMFQNQDAARAKSPMSGKPTEIDALLYSANMIFGLARSGVNDKGYLNLNGSIIAADTGLLAGGQITINYDKRTAQYIHIVDTSQVSPLTLAWKEK